MTPLQAAYGWLALAISAEVAATAALQKTEQFTKFVPTLAVGVLYASSFYFLSQALRGMPLGVAYAIWAGLGVVLTALISVVAFRQTLDPPAMVGIGMIVCGVAVINLLSQSASH